MGVNGIPLVPHPRSGRRVHSNDERVSSDSFARRVKIVREAVRRVAE